jgi:Cytochrome c554 and c-prime
MRHLQSSKLLQLVLVISTMAIHVAWAQDARNNSLSLTTQDRLEDAGWWPTKGDSSRSEFVGSTTCRACHADVSTSQETTPMYHAAVRAAQSEILETHKQLNFQDTLNQYSLRHTTSGVTYSVSEGETSAMSNVGWAFGEGNVGQTYLLEKNGAYIESRLSYYSALSALDITIGAARDAPSELDKALGQPLNHETVQHCFSCHTTVAVTSNIFEPEKAIPGVTCEACHGPGAKHVAAMKIPHSEQASRNTIMNPEHLSPSDSVDFCGACHRTWSDVAIKMPANIGVASIRFQPYRLERSRCWGKNGDARITCIACHDPHEPLVRDSRLYDSKCLACHLTKGQPQQKAATAPTCKVSTSNCVSCHMPKYEVPQSHTTFTDHYIRIVRAGAGFPS